MFIYALIIIMIFGFMFLRYGAKEGGKSGILFRGEGEYIGGFSDAEGGKKITCLIDKNCLHFNGKLTRNIKLCDIKGVSIKSETQIQSDMSLAMKNKKTLVNNYSIMDIIRQGRTETIILNMQDNERFVKRVQKLI